MLTRHKRYYCPLCKGDLGLYDPRFVFLVTCVDPDCQVKWCWKPGAEKPIALSYPGLKEPKVCTCASCKTRGSTDS